MSAPNYTVTAQKSTAVTACVTGNFTEPTDLNLVLAKNTRLEIYFVTPLGLRAIKEVDIYEKIAVIKFFRPQYENKDLLFLLTAKYNAMILLCTGRGKDIEIITKAHGNIADTIGKASKTGIKAVIDPEARVIGLKLEDGPFHFIPIGKNDFKLEAFPIRMDNETNIMDFDFLHGCKNPTFILIHNQDTNRRHVETYEISVSDKEFLKMPWKLDNNERKAMMVIPVPLPVGGAIIIGQESISYQNNKMVLPVTSPIIKQSIFTCYAKVDNQGQRFLLGDTSGRLLMMFVEHDKRSDGTPYVKDLKLEFLGEVSIPECITYLDNDFIFIGSTLGDSQLVKLGPKADDTDSYFSVIESFTNLAPIIDMAVVDQGQIVTCSGAFKEGSLRVIRNGIEIHQLAVIELADINGIWALKVANNTYDNTIVLSFVGETKIIRLNEKELEEIEISGFVTDEPTFYAGNVTNNLILQVTPTSARLISTELKSVLSEWTPENKRSISVVACNGAQLLCAIAKDLHFMEISDNQIVSKASTELQHEVACLDITPLDGTNDAKLVAVGLWTDISVCILTLPNLEEINKELLGGGFIPRSILMKTFEENTYLLCTLGDGSMYYFLLNQKNGRLIDKEKVTLGTKPTVLKTFRSLSTTYVFACSDRPKVIYCCNKKILFDNINMNEIRHMCSLNAELYCNSLAFVTNREVFIVKMNKKLHIQNVPLGESPRGIAYQESTQTFGVITMRIDVMEQNVMRTVRQSASTTVNSISSSTQNNSHNEPTNTTVNYSQQVQVHNLLIINGDNFEVLHAHTLMPTEYATCLISSAFGDNPTDAYFIIGVGSRLEKGRILIFQWQDGKLDQIAEITVEGSCNLLIKFNDKILACVDNRILLFEFTADKELRLECTYINKSPILCLKTKDDYVLIGDFMYPVTLLQYKTMEGSFEVASRDCKSETMTDIEIFGQNYFVGAESSCSLIVWQKSSEEQKKKELKKLSQFFLNDKINTMKHGSLVIHHSGKFTHPESSIIYGSVSGAIGLVTHIAPKYHAILKILEAKVRSYVLGSDLKNEVCQRLVDGNLIESFLDLSHEKMTEVIQDLTIDEGDGMEKDVTIENIIEIVEDLVRLH